MKLFFKILIVLILCYAGSQAYQSFLKYRQEVEANKPVEKMDVLDGLIGRQAIGQYNRVKELRDQFNIPAFKTTMVMYYTQNGHYPNSMQELEQSGDASRDMTHDRFGNLYQLNLQNNKHVTLQSAGRDRIAGTTDDVKHQFDL